MPELQNKLGSLKGPHPKTGQIQKLYLNIKCSFSFFETSLDRQQEAQETFPTGQHSAGLKKHISVD